MGDLGDERVDITGDRIDIGAGHLDEDRARDLVGDSARDVLAGHDLPVRTVLVRSGKPIDAQREALLAAGVEPDLEVADLRAAADAILASAPGA